MHQRTRLIFPATLLVTLAIAPGLARSDDSIEARLRPLIDGFKGKVAIAVKNLDTGETFLTHENDPMPTASLIKFPVMIETYRQSAEGKANLDETITLKKEDKVQGSGILTYHFSDGVTFPLKDAVHLMMVYSDNTATNLVVDKIGIGSTAATMEKMVTLTPSSIRRSFAATPRSSPNEARSSAWGAQRPSTCSDSSNRSTRRNW